MGRHGTAVVVAGGDAPLAHVRELVPDGAYVIAADSGHDHARALGIVVHRIVGDLDSADPRAVEIAVAGGAELEAHPPEKDATDLELALHAAMEWGVRDVLVIGGYGGRLDHLLANALVIAAPEFASMHVRAYLGAAIVTVVHTEATIMGVPGDVCSLLAVGSLATDVRTTGLRYPLDGGELRPGSTLGVSNELVADAATITVGSGTVLVIQPEWSQP